MNEQEAEEECAFIKGALGALETLASDIEDIRLDAHVLEMNIVARRREAYKIRDEIKKYFGMEGNKPSSKEQMEEEEEMIAQQQADAADEEQAIEKIKEAFG